MQTTRGRLVPAVLIIVAASWAAPLTPTPQTEKSVPRVPGRKERPLLRFPAQEQWRATERQAAKGVETRSFQPQAPSGSPAVDLATVTILHDIWNADLEQAQHQFGRQLSAECEGVRARLLRADTLDVPRRLVQWTCEKGPQPFSALQLLVQGHDDLFSVELFSQSGLLSEGLSVRWADWLWESGICLNQGAGLPCPPDNWDRLPTVDKP